MIAHSVLQNEPRQTFRLTARPDGNAPLTNRFWIRTGSVVPEAAMNCAAHAPFAAPMTVKHIPPLVPQKQLVGSPEAEQVAEFAARQL